MFPYIGRLSQNIPSAPGTLQESYRMTTRLSSLVTHGMPFDEVRDFLGKL